jgi:hypothetical protein
VLPWTLPGGYFDFKKGLYDKYGIRFSVAYQMAYQKVSDSLSDKDTAWGGWFSLEGAWTILNRGKDNQGEIVAALDARHTINKSDNATPGKFYREFGSLWATDGGFLDWDLYPGILFWEQQLGKDAFGFRVGQQAPEMVLDYFRFGDARTQFSGTQLSFPASTIPYPAAGLGLSARWFPIASSDIYLRGIIQDINAPTGKFDWSALFVEGEVFAGAELGHSWNRAKDDFDHAHLMMWYADETSTKSYPTDAGWGAKVHGSKQWKKIVAFGNYSYNTAEGGGLGLTNSRHAVNVGGAWLRPFRFNGEIALAGSWAEPIDDTLRDQYGLEAYWKLLLTPSLWVTPGFQYIWDPTFNTTTDSLSLFSIKARLFF